MITFKEYKGLLRLAQWLLRHHPDVMLLADRGEANHELMHSLAICPLDFELRSYFWQRKSGAFEERRFSPALRDSLERLYLVAAVALLYGTTQGMAVQVAGLRQQVDPHWHRGISYLKIGLRWLQGVLHSSLAFAL